MAFQRTRILILCKTYPSPSSRNVETSCVAGMTIDGRLLRLYPVPFRLLNDQSQFRKWQWIEADIEKARNDHRPESHRFRAPTEPPGHENRLKIVDWEAGALYWNVTQRRGPDWQPAFRDKFETALPASDLLFLAGTIHRFPDQWLIVSVIYPPKQPQVPLDLG
jgi:hypothetical protein